MGNSETQNFWIIFDLFLNYFWSFWKIPNPKFFFEILNLKKEIGKIPNPKSETQLWKLIQNPEFQFWNLSKIFGKKKTPLIFFKRNPWKVEKLKNLKNKKNLKNS